MKGIVLKDTDNTSGLAATGSEFFCREQKDDIFSLGWGRGIRSVDGVSGCFCVAKSIAMLGIVAFTL